mmetsp:Transcript_102990/g.182948  ORF Transcript_102990/g.182948 Transcript_102990/m.182948 type:complete len:299 (-) Transcript_102990:45-941(-)
MGCGASSKYAERNSLPATSKTLAITQGPVAKLEGHAWIEEGRRLVQTLAKLEDVLRELLAAEQNVSQETPGSYSGDRKLALQLILEDATAERQRLERRLEEDPEGADPINLPELAASLLRTLEPLLTAQAQARGVTMPATQSGSGQPMVTRGALVQLSEQVDSLALVARSTDDAQGSQQLQIRLGTSVSISGLVTAPELNGLVGIVESFDAGASRWTVCLPNGEKKRVKQSNLQVVPEVPEAKELSDLLKKTSQLPIEERKTLFREQALRFHPDKNSAKNAAACFAYLQNAKGWYLGL